MNPRVQKICGSAAHKQMFLRRPDKMRVSALRSNLELIASKRPLGAILGTVVSNDPLMAGICWFLVLSSHPKAPAYSIESPYHCLPMQDALAGFVQSRAVAVI